MKISAATFVMSNSDYKACPKPTLPEFAFIGRSNVGKSSLINMLLSKKNLAKTSSAPGKTQLINHFIINDAWYLVDLPGYGYAKVSKNQREKWQKLISSYLRHRENLTLVFILIDVRLEPQKIDLEFINWCGEEQIPFSLVLTKLDKVSRAEAQRNLMKLQEALLESWEELPPFFATSATNGEGREALLGYIDSLIRSEVKV
jgi:GTP-binding protein